VALPLAFGSPWISLAISALLALFFLAPMPDRARAADHEGGTDGLAHAAKRSRTISLTLKAAISAVSLSHAKRLDTSIACSRSSRRDRARVAGPLALRTCGGLALF
jgi:hypothetical protein